MSESILSKMMRARETEESFKRQAGDKELVVIRQNEKGKFVDYNNHPCKVKPIGEPFIVGSYNEIRNELKKYWNSYTKEIRFPKFSKRIGVVIGEGEYLDHDNNRKFSAVQLYSIL